MSLSLWLGTATVKLIGKTLPKLAAPFLNRLVDDEDPSVEHHLLDITEAEGKSEIQPCAVANDFTREAVTTIQVGRLVHELQYSRICSSKQPAINLTIPSCVLL